MIAAGARVEIVGTGEFGKVIPYVDPVGDEYFVELDEDDNGMKWRAWFVEDELRDCDGGGQ